MENIYISIGSQCSSATLLKQKNLRTSSYPFDWLLSHLDFVYDVFVSLYNDPIEKTVEIFLDTENNTVYSSPTTEPNESLRYVDDFGNIHNQRFEYYRTVHLGETLTIHPFNRKYKISFPHDSIVIEKEKYLRRLLRLKESLLNEDIFISFLYLSPSSNKTHYCINDEILTSNASEKLNKLCSFLETKRKNFKIIFVDSLGENKPLNHNINKIVVEPYKNWYPMINKNNIIF